MMQAFIPADYERNKTSIFTYYNEPLYNCIKQAYLRQKHPNANFDYLNK